MKYLVSQWQEFLANEKGFSKHTVSAYIIDLNYFIEFITLHTSSNCSLSLLESLSLQDFRAWLSFRKKENFAFSSTTRAVAAVKNFFKFLIRFHNLANKAIFNLKTPKLATPLTKALNEKQTFSASTTLKNTVPLTLTGTLSFVYAS